MPPHLRSIPLRPKPHHKIAGRPGVSQLIPSSSPYARERRCPYCHDPLTLPAISEGNDLLHLQCHTARRVDRLERIIEAMAQMLPLSLHNL